MCFGGRDDSEVKRSREIDALIHRDEKQMQKIVKLLLLGKPFELLTANHIAILSIITNYNGGIQELERAGNRRS